MTRLCFAGALLFAVVSTAQAQPQLKLQIADGRVTLEATSVPVRQILAEWARVGGTRVVGADRIPGGPVTLKFVNMPEAQALDILLRGAAGFMAAPRAAHAAPGASTFDRILVLATTSGTPTAAAANTTNRPGVSAPIVNGRRLPPPRPAGLAPRQPDPAEEEEDEEEFIDEEEDAASADEQPVFTFPSPAQGGFGTAPGANGPVFVPGQAGTTPVITLQPGPNGQPTVYTFNPAAVGPDGQPITPSMRAVMDQQNQQNQQNQAPAPGSFGVIGAPTPGMIQLPAAGQPGQPQPAPIRPPGQ